MDHGDATNAFKSDRCGIETMDIEALLSDGSSSNQTVAGLKPLIIFVNEITILWFKSDRCGIETFSLLVGLGSD